MKTREEIINAIENCAAGACNINGICAYKNMNGGCIGPMMRDVLTLIQMQKARLITANDFENGDTDAGGALPVWKEARSATRRSGWAVIVYGKWLCDTRGGAARYWTYKPTDEQRELEAWDDGMQ